MKVGLFALQKGINVAGEAFAHQLAKYGTTAGGQPGWLRSWYSAPVPEGAGKLFNLQQDYRRIGQGLTDYRRHLKIKEMVRPELLESLHADANPEATRAWLMSAKAQLPKLLALQGSNRKFPEAAKFYQEIEKHLKDLGGSNG